MLDASSSVWWSPLFMLIEQTLVINCDTQRFSISSSEKSLPLGTELTGETSFVNCGDFAYGRTFSRCSGITKQCVRVPFGSLIVVRRSCNIFCSCHVFLHHVSKAFFTHCRCGVYTRGLYWSWSASIEKKSWNWQTSGAFAFCAFAAVSFFTKREKPIPGLTGTNSIVAIRFCKRFSCAWTKHCQHLPPHGCDADAQPCGLFAFQTFLSTTVGE